MILKQPLSLIITVVENGFSEKVIEASKLAGAEGATLLNGRGTSVNEQASFMGVAIQPEKEIVLILARKTQRKNIMKEIVRVCNLSTSGKGLSFCVPVDEIVGASHLIGNPKRLFNSLQNKPKKKKECPLDKEQKEEKKAEKPKEEKESKKS